jgi:hypothetical protein
MKAPARPWRKFIGIAHAYRDAGERKLRGTALKGSEQKAAADHVEYETGRNPDMELHLDGETDTLYSDGIDIEEDFDTLAGTHGSSGTIP